MVDMALQIEVVYQRALLLQQRAVDFPINPDLLEKAISELYFVLEELRVSEEELQRQNHALREAQQQIDAERQRYQDLFDLAPDGYVVTDSYGIIQEANQAIASMLNRSQSFLIGKPLALFVAEEDRPEFYTKLNQLNQFRPIPQSRVQNWNTIICPPQGNPLDVEISLSITHTRQGSVVSFRWLLHDITQQKQTNALLGRLNTQLEHQVQQRTAQLQQALDFETSLTHITDTVRNSLDEDQILQGVVQELTRVLHVVGCEITFYDLSCGMVTTCYRSSLPGEAAIAPPSPQEAIRAMTIFPDGYRQLVQGQVFQFCELVPTVGLTQVAILMCPITDEFTVLGGLYVFKPVAAAFSDTEIRLVQQVANQCAIAIRQARLYQTAQQQVQDLEQLNHLKDDFLSTVSHELRTPLSNMSMAIYMLDMILQQPEKFADKQLRFERYQNILRSECRHEIGLVNNLLELTQLDSTKESLVLSTLDLADWLPPVIEPFTARCHNQQQQLQVEIPAGLPNCTTDASLLRRILTELLNNACKYTPPHEAIAIVVNATDAGLQCSVRNSGVDLLPQELDQLFDKFYRIPTHDPWKHGGTGLGLALVRKQVERLHGTINATHSPPWLLFTLQLPWHID